MRARAIAHPNVALIKYWGKSDSSQNIPAVGSLSLTLSGLETVTEVEFSRDLDEDRVRINGETDSGATRRVVEILDLVRKRSGITSRALVETRNNFPTAAGLASSASGFAALVVALSAVIDRSLTVQELETFARLGSGSAPRSLFDGICLMELTGRPEQPTACRTVSDVNRWPLEVVIAITQASAKKIDSRTAMEACASSSPFFESWVSSHPADLVAATRAVAEKDFEALAAVSEFSCLKMHATAMAARPGINYWRGATVECMESISNLRSAGTPVFFTIDAGPQVKAICEPTATAIVRDALASVPGVVDVRVCRLGHAARLDGLVD
jgi:diphosphomevalonate decarboxylase